MVALVTPMHEDQSIDFAALESLVEFHLQNETDGMVVVGTTGEAAVLSLQEQAKVISHVVNQVKGKIPIIAGTASQSTHQCIINTKQAEALGADGALIMTPAYIKPPQSGLLAHYQAIAAETSLPIILYNVPSRTACDLQLDTVVELSAIDNIVAIKEASGDLERCQAIIECAADDFAVLSGEDALTVDMMKLGAQGVISVTANIAPKLMHQLCSAALAGDFEQAYAINQQLSQLHDDLFIESNPIPCKWLLAQLGLCQPTLRLPLVMLSAENQQKLSLVKKPEEA